MYKPLTFTLLLLFFCSSCLISGGRTCSVRLIDNLGRPLTLHVEIADTEQLRMKGLMNRRHLASDSGMLFVFENERIRNFWMKDTYLPLSIAYIAADGTINELYDMEPLDTSLTYPSSRPAMYALEVNMGWFKDNGISRGCRILLDGCVGK